MEWQCEICKKKFSSERSMISHRGWHKRYRKKFENAIRKQLKHLSRLKPTKTSINKPMQVEFEIEKKSKKIKVRPCQADGQCLFEALWFQTEAKNYDYIESEVQNFKKKILKRIESDDEFYRPFIEAHLSELMVEEYFTEYLEADEEEKKEARDELMEKISTGDEWGSFETIAAVKKMHKVNCVKFNVDDGTFNLLDFEYSKSYRKIVFVAFENLNHYDTVIHIREKDIPDIARELAKRIV